MSDHGAVRTTRLRIGGVLSRGIGIYLRNIVAFLILTFLAFLPGFLVEFAAISVAPVTDLVNVILSLFMMLLWILGWCWFSAGVTYGVIADLRGHRASIGEVLGASMRPVLALTLLTLLMSLVVVIFLSIPTLLPLSGLLLGPLAIALYIVLWVTVPAMVVENLGPIAGLRRSLALTRGSFWRIFGIVVLWLAFILAVSFVVGLFTGATDLEGEHVGTSLSAGTSADWISNIVAFVMFGMGAAVSAVGYHDLRIAREGGDTEQIAKAFD